MKQSPKLTKLFYTENSNLTRISIMAFKSFLCIYLLLKSIHFVQLSSVKDKYDFDIIIFTQLWPATDCMEWKKNNPHHTCNMPQADDTWTVHGIWPTKYGAIGPGFCNRTWLFDPEQVRPIENQLEQAWANIYGGTTIYALWAHEWNKHGTCAAILEPFNSELKYFSKGLEWLDKFSMSKILKSSQIIPSNIKKYSIRDINDAIKNKIGADPAIHCKRENDKDYMSDIRICFTKELKNINCDGIKKFNYKYFDGETILTNCKSEDIVYPHYNKWYVQLYKLVTWLQWFTL